MFTLTVDLGITMGSNGSFGAFCAPATPTTPCSTASGGGPSLSPPPIHVGDTVLWQFTDDSVVHNVENGPTGAPPPPPPTFGTPSAGQSSGIYSFTYNHLGMFNFQCTLHTGMTGTITVNP
jgi:hypothetical protein